MRIHNSNGYDTEAVHNRVLEHRNQSPWSRSPLASQRRGKSISSPLHAPKFEPRLEPDGRGPMVSRFQFQEVCWLLPDQKFCKGTQLYDHLFTRQAESAPNFVMGRVYEHYLHVAMVSIEHFDENGNQTSGPSGYTPYLSTETRAYPPVFTTKRHLIDKTKTRTLTLDDTYYGG